MYRLASALVLDCDLSELRLLLERYAGVLLDQSSDYLRERIAQYAAAVQIGTGADLIASLRASAARMRRVAGDLAGPSWFFLTSPGAIRCL